MVKFGYTILYVEDVEQTINFYVEAFGFEKKMITPEKDYAELNSGETTLAFANIELGKSNFKNGFKKSNTAELPFGFELAFTTDDVELLMQKSLNLGASLLSKVEEKPWGQKVGYVRDINGFLIEVCTPIS